MRSMNPTYRKTGQRLTVASLASSSTAVRLRSLRPMRRAATAGAGQFVLGQLMNDLDTRQVCRQRLALATARSGRHHFFFRVLDRQHRVAFRLVEQGQLRGVGFGGLFGFAPEQTVAQQLDLLFQVDDMAFMRLQHFGCFCLTSQRLKQQLLEQNRIIWEVIGPGNHGPDYTGSGHEARR